MKQENHSAKIKYTSNNGALFIYIFFFNHRKKLNPINFYLANNLMPRKTQGKKRLSFKRL